MCRREFSTFSEPEPACLLQWRKQRAWHSRAKLPGNQSARNAQAQKGPSNYLAVAPYGSKRAVASGASPGGSIQSVCRAYRRANTWRICRPCARRQAIASGVAVQSPVAPASTEFKHLVSQAVQRQRSRRCAVPNPSVKRSANGMPLGPGSRYGVHCLQPGPSGIPLAPAYLER